MQQTKYLLDRGLHELMPPALQIRACFSESFFAPNFIAHFGPFIFLR